MSCMFDFENSLKTRIDQRVGTSEVLQIYIRDKEQQKEEKRETARERASKANFTRGINCAQSCAVCAKEKGIPIDSGDNDKVNLANSVFRKEIQRKYSTTKTDCNRTLEVLNRAEPLSEGYKFTGKILGYGAYSKVRLAKVQQSKIEDNCRVAAAVKENGHYVAVKIIDKSRTSLRYVQKFMQREAKAIQAVAGHTNIVQVYDIYETHSRMCIAMEYCPGGSLLDLVNQSHHETGSGLPEELSRKLFNQITAGLMHCHRNGVVHRDIKCENILLDAHRNAKITDFGFACVVPNKRHLLETACGSYAYAAPELVYAKKYDGMLADTWSLGVVMFSMVNGYLPFDERKIKQMYDNMRMQRLKFSPKASHEAKTLMRQILHWDPFKRPKLCDITESAWAKGCKLKSADKSRLSPRKSGEKERSPVNPPSMLAYTPPLRHNRHIKYATVSFRSGMDQITLKSKVPNLCREKLLGMPLKKVSVTVAYARMETFNMKDQFDMDSDRATGCKTEIREEQERSAISRLLSRLIDSGNIFPVPKLLCARHSNTSTEYSPLARTPSPNVVELKGSRINMPHSPLIPNIPGTGTIARRTSSTNTFWGYDRFPEDNLSRENSRDKIDGNDTTDDRQLLTINHDKPDTEILDPMPKDSKLSARDSVSILPPIEATNKVSLVKVADSNRESNSPSLEKLADTIQNDNSFKMVTPPLVTIATSSPDLSYFEKCLPVLDSKTKYIEDCVKGLQISETQNVDDEIENEAQSVPDSSSSEDDLASSDGKSEPSSPTSQGSSIKEEDRFSVKDEETQSETDDERDLNPANTKASDLERPINYIPDHPEPQTGSYSPDSRCLPSRNNDYDYEIARAMSGPSPIGEHMSDRNMLSPSPIGVNVNTGDLLMLNKARPYTMAGATITSMQKQEFMASGSSKKLADLYKEYVRSPQSRSPTPQQANLLLVGQTHKTSRLLKRPNMMRYNKSRVMSMPLVSPRLNRRTPPPPKLPPVKADQKRKKEREHKRKLKAAISDGYKIHTSPRDALASPEDDLVSQNDDNEAPTILTSKTDAKASPRKTPPFQTDISASPKNTISWQLEARGSPKVAVASQIDSRASSRNAISTHTDARASPRDHEEAPRTPREIYQLRSAVMDPENYLGVDIESSCEETSPYFLDD